MDREVGRDSGDLTSHPFSLLLTFLWLVSLTNQQWEKTVIRKVLCKDTESCVFHPFLLRLQWQKAIAFPRSQQVRSVKQLGEILGLVLLFVGRWK